MLPRVLEPEVMDSHDEAMAYDAMDHDDVNRRFVDDLLSAGLLDQDPAADPAATIDVLDLGCGTGQIPVELCRRNERLRVLAVDLSDSMLSIARQKIEIASLAGRIVLGLEDASQLPQESDSFAAVVSNSLIHHLPEPAAAFAEAVRTVMPGGLLFFRDLLRPPDDAAVKRLVYQYTRNETDQQQRLFDNSLRAALGLEEVRKLVAALGYDPQGVRTTSDRHWTWVARKRVRRES